MLTAPLRIHDPLRIASRLPVLSRPEGRLTARELAVLLATGAVAALAAAGPDFHLRIPGHAILRAVFPMALGMALVPRRGGGLIMGGSALATAFACRLSGAAGLGAGTMTSLSLTGPLLDLALWRMRRGWQLYLGFILAGLASNLIALLARGGLKLLVPSDSPGGHAIEVWWRSAMVTYPLCGIVAGLVSAAVWFQIRNQSAGPTDQGDSAKVLESPSIPGERLADKQP
jgi:hypothetical protein